MAEPLDPELDFIETIGSVRKIAVAFYQAGERDNWATAVTARGVRDGRRVEMAGEVRRTRATWWVTGLETRPPLRSRITYCDETWVVDAITSDPADVVLQCECTLQ